ncbi:hypothetical protein CR513_47851, partial [Mucuna pruriens]
MATIDTRRDGDSNNKEPSPSSMNLATKEIQLEYYLIEDQIANIFTKALARAKFEQFQTMLGVIKICIKKED